jgi:hypothetical protein
MMGGKTPETYWAVNKRQDNKLKNCCIWLVIYLKTQLLHNMFAIKRLQEETIAVYCSQYYRMWIVVFDYYFVQQWNLF